MSSTRGKLKSLGLKSVVIGMSLTAVAVAATVWFLATLPKTDQRRWSSAVTGGATVALVMITGLYAWFTYQLVLTADPEATLLVAQRGESMVRVRQDAQETQFTLTALKKRFPLSTQARPLDANSVTKLGELGNDLIWRASELSEAFRTKCRSAGTAISAPSSVLAQLNSAFHSSDQLEISALRENYETLEAQGHTGIGWGQVENGSFLDEAFGPVTAFVDALNKELLSKR